MRDAELIFSYAEARGSSRAGMEVSFEEEEGKLLSIRLTVPGCPWSERAEMEKELGAYYSVPVTVGTGD